MPVFLVIARTGWKPVLLPQFQHFPQRWVVGDGEVPVDAEELVAARDAIASGGARAKLDQLATFTRGFAKTT